MLSRPSKTISGPVDPAAPGASAAPDSPASGSATGDEPPPAIEVAVTDEQDDVPIDLDRWKRLVGDVLADCGVHGPGEASVLFVDRDSIAELNETHMGHAGPTDVLSFPIDADDDLDAAWGDTDGAGERLVGDIVICPSVAAANAADHAGTLDDELALLVVHGTLHLLGHDHATDGERTEMWARERELLGRHWGPLAKDPWRS